MTVTCNAKSRKGASDTAVDTGDISWTHTPSGTPRWVAVSVDTDLNTDQVAGVTYGGVAMELAGTTPRNTSETGRVHWFFLGESVPTGAQTVLVDVTSSTAKVAHAFSGPAASDCEVDVYTGSDLGVVANPSLTLTFSGSLSSWVAAVTHYYGGSAPVSTNLRSSATYGYGADFGSASAMSYYITGAAAASSVAVGYSTLASDDQLIAGIVIKESSSTLTTEPSGVSVATAVGAPAITQTVPASGVAVVATVGSTSVAVLVAVDGITVPTAAGAAAVDQDVPASGVAALAELGAVSVTQTVPVAGVDVPVDVGSVSTGSVQTTAPAGIPVAVELGVVDVGQGVPVAGVSLTVTAGDPSTFQGESTQPSGVDVPVGVGAPGVRQTVPAAGVAVSVQVGAASTSQGVQFAEPGGVSVSTAVGAVAVDQTVPGAGVAVPAGVGAVSVNVTVPLSAVSVAVSVGSPLVVAAGDATPVSAPRVTLTVPVSVVALTTPAGAAALAIPTAAAEVTNMDGWTRNDTGPALVATLSSTPASSFTGAVVEVHVRKPSGDVVTVPDDQVDFDLDDGVVTVDWTTGDLDEAGTYAAEFQVTYSNTDVQTFGGASFLVAAELA